MSTPHDRQGPLRPARRRFLADSGRLALAAGVLPMGIDLAGLARAAQAATTNGASDYKALVCLFMLGGNDHDNTVVPYDAPSHARYAAIRSAGGGRAIALARTALESTALTPRTPLPGGRQYALHPNMGGLARLFARGHAAVQLNVGPLTVPLTRAQYEASAKLGLPLPPKLFSHNDQQSVWQAFSSEGATLGWGGGFADALEAGNASPLLSCIGFGGGDVLLAGRARAPYRVGLGGAMAIGPAVVERGPLPSALLTLLTQRRQHLLEDEYTRIVRRSIEAESVLTPALDAVPEPPAMPPTFLGQQLRTVAKIIGARSALGARRQVFLVRLGGFDTHSGQSGTHGALLKQVSDAVTAFFDATVAAGVSEQVTLFTASDFGRTLSTNGDGTDHGWGAHHVVVGGAVRGGEFYGRAPPVSIGDTAALDDQWHVGQGRLLPSTSVAQYAATLGRWFGVPESDLATVIPALRNFGAAAGRPDYPVNLGFLG